MRKDDSLSNEIDNNIQNRIRLIKEEIFNTKYAIQWAKFNLINRLLLRKLELNAREQFFKKAEASTMLIEEMLEFTDVSMLHNETDLIYIIKVPQITKEHSQNLVVRPIIRENIILNLEFKDIFQNQNLIFGINNNCNNCKKL